MQNTRIVDKYWAKNNRYCPRRTLQSDQNPNTLSASFDTTFIRYANGKRSTMIFGPFFRYLHKKGVRTLRSSVDILMQRERDDPDEFATTGIVLPVVLAGLREKTKRPIDVILRPEDLTYRQREEIIRTIDAESRRIDIVLNENPEDDAAYYSRVCLNWLELLQQAYFRAADMPDVIPEMTVQVRDDISDLVFRALDNGATKLEDLPQTADESPTVH